jgi:hypothetical protein
MLTNIICGKEVKAELDELGGYVSTIVTGLVKEDADVYDKHHGQLYKAMLKSRAAIRKELGAEDGKY